MPQVLLQVRDLARQFALAGAVLRILLLDLGQVLELDGLALEDTSLHVLDQLLLLLSEQLILKLHPVDLLLHGHDLSLTDRWVQSVLHLFLKLVLPLPEKNLLLSIDDVNQDVTLLLLKLSDLVLQLNRLVFHLLKLLLELHFDVKVVVGELLLSLIVLIDQVIQLVHLEHLVLLGDLELPDCLVVTIDLRVDSDLLLVKDGLLGSQVVVLTIDLRLLLLTLDQLNLVGDPVFLDVGSFFINLLDLLLNVVALVFNGTDEFITITATLERSALTVEPVHSECLLLNAQQSSLDVLLDLLDIFLFLFELANQIVKLLLEHLVLGSRVQVIETDTGDLIGIVLNLDFLLRDALICLLCLLEQVS